MKVTNIKSFQQFDKFYKDFQESKMAQKGNDGTAVKTPLVLFVASREDCSDQSWCSDCRLAKPVLEKIMKEFEFNEQLSLVQVEVGSRDEWINPENPYRNHELQIERVPTLLSLGNPKLRLVDEDCANSTKLKHLFSNSI